MSIIYSKIIISILLMILSIQYAFKASRRMWFFASTYKNNSASLEGQTVVITGANSGIGLETAKDLYKRGARVLILCREENTSLQVIDDIKNEETQFDTSYLKYKHIDLADFASVRKCAEELLREEKQISILINNAGVMVPPNKTLKNGLETHITVNHLGGALLTLLLLPRMTKSAHARIIFVSSIAHSICIVGGKISPEDLHYKNRRFFSPQAYGQSKLAQVIFSKELARRLKAHNITNVTTYSLHPGGVATGIADTSDSLICGLSWFWKKFSSYLLMTPAQGASTTIYCVVEEKLKCDSGFYYRDCKETRSHPVSYDEELAKRLWDTTVEYVELQNYDPFKPEV